MKKIILLTSLLTFVAILTASAQSWTNGLTSCYPFHGNANDVVGGDNGTATNVVLAVDRFGNSNSAYRFNGTNSAVDVPPLTLNNLTSGTISTWIELDRNSAEALFAKQVDGANSFGVFTVGIYSDVNGGEDFGDAGRLYFRSRNGGPLASSSTLLSTGAWHQVAVTFTTTNCNLYIDGVPSGSAAGDFSIPDYLTPTTTSIGSWELDLPSSLYVTLAGTIDDFRIFDQALSPDELSQMYETTSTNPVSSIQSWTNGLASYYPFNGNANDIIGGYNGTVSNAVLVADRFQTPASAYQFNGTNSAILVPAATLNNLPEGTISTWVELDADSNEVIFAKELEGSDSVGVFTVGMYLGGGGERLAGDAGRLYFHSRNGGASAFSSTLLTTGVWYQVAVTFSTNACTFYVNGVAAGTTAGDFSIPDEPTVTGTSIGFWYSANPPYSYSTLAGTLDDFRIFDRALTANDTAQLFAFDSTNTPSWQNSMTSYYPLNGDAKDVIGGQNGTPTNVVFINDRFQNPDSAALYTNTDSAIFVPATALNNLSSGTIATWVELNDNTQEALFAKEIEGADSSGVLTVGVSVGGGGERLTGDPGRLYFHNQNGGSSASATTLLTTGVWYHVAVTFTTTNCTFYVNGIAAGTASGDFTIPDEPSANGTCIGYWYSALPPYYYETFSGELDDFRIFNRALAPAEISEIYTLGTSGSSVPSWQTGLTSYYPLDGNATDVISNFDGIVSNAVPVADRWQVPNSAYYFNGSNAAILVPPAMLNNSPAGTLAAWVKLDENTNEVLFAKEFEGHDSSAVLSVGLYVGGGGERLVGDPGRLYFHAYNGGPLVSSSIVLTTGVWYQVAVSFSTNGSTLYINGAASGTAVGDFQIPDETDITGATIGYWYSAFTPFDYSTFAGTLDDFRVYGRVLSPVEVGQMFAATVPPGGVRAATAFAIVTNGIVGGVQIIDGGAGYTNIPVVRFIGSGTGAQATVVVSNGVVTEINIINPGTGYTNAPLVFIDAPIFTPPSLGISPLSSLSFNNLGATNSYQLQQLVHGVWSSVATSVTATNGVYDLLLPGTINAANYRLVPYPAPRQATAFAQVVNGFVVGAFISSGGSGYVTNPVVTITGGGGTNATAVSKITNGVVTGITIVTTGSGYASPPSIRLTAPPTVSFPPQVQTSVGLYSSSLIPYGNYQVQMSTNLSGPWVDWSGGAFTSMDVTNAQIVPTANGAIFFRLQYLP